MERCTVYSENELNDHKKNGWEEDNSKDKGPNGEIYLIRDISHSTKMKFAKDLS